MRTTLQLLEASVTAMQTQQKARAAFEEGTAALLLMRTQVRL